MPPPYGPMDFAAWFEAFLDGHWYTFDPRNSIPRIGRVLIGRGRDAADVPISNSFGPITLASFKVWTDAVPAGARGEARNVRGGSCFIACEVPSGGEVLASA